MKQKKYHKKTKNNHKNQKTEIVQGVLSLTKKGYGFVDLSKNCGIFVSQKHLNGAFHGDFVEAKTVLRKGKQECEIVKILERGISVVTGIVTQVGNHYFLQPYQKNLPYDFFIKKAHLNGAVPGDLAVGEIISYDSDPPTIYLKEVLGSPEKTGNDMTMVLRKYGITEEFSPEVSEQPLPDISEEELASRVDYTQQTVITIDGDDAKDLDDAISIEKTGAHYRLGVHIADVSYFVKGRTPMDNEAFFRGTSVYLPDRAVPMLPQKLSNGLCSLHPGEIKLTFSCVMEIDREGNIVSYRLEKSYIKSRQRTSYSKVKAFLEGESVPEYEGIRSTLELCFELYQILKKKRQQAGYVEISFPETAFHLSEDGIPDWVGPYEVSFANEMIEEFMWAANVSVADYAMKENLPFVYRIHGSPEIQKLEQLYSTLKLFGLKTPKSVQPTPAALNEILKNAEGTPYREAVHQLALRSMQKAVYSSQCSSHYGLNFTKYCHFTSPIRRYPDLVIHRILSDYLLGKSVKKYQKFVADAAEQSSQAEQNAFFAEREADDIKKAQYMKNRVGEICDGYISGLCETGFFVMLPNTVEGFVPLHSLEEDFYEYQQASFQISGRQTKHIYSLGQKVSVMVKHADTIIGKIEFELVSA
ncbi:MAG: ribonuclease R [Clostridia bacterium]|nr:ribonuclease R [Clostridia bacterium]